MKQKNFKKLALLSVAAATFLAQAHVQAATNTSYKGNYTADSSDSMMKTSNKMSEADLMSQLNADGKATYQSLDQEGKDLAMKLANQSCKGQNECKGLNSCKTANNACAGQGGCKGQSKGPFTDKNDAVKVAAKHMADKRAMMMNK